MGEGGRDKAMNPSMKNTIQRMQNIFRSHDSHRRFWGSVITILIVLVNVAVLTVVMHNKMPAYPVGWDAPYYITRVNQFIELGVLSNRIGFVTSMASVQSVTGLPNVSLYIYFTVFITTLFSLFTALLASRVFLRHTFVLIFLATFWFVNSLALTTTTFDNALGLSLCLLAVYALSKRSENAVHAIPFFIVVLALSFTHFESYLFFLGVFVIYALLVIFQKRSVGIFIREYKWFILPVIVSTVVAYIHWSDVVSAIFTYYTVSADPTGNASVPYSQSASLREFFRLTQSGIWSYAQSVVSVLGLTVLAWSVLRKKDSHAIPVLAYALAGYALLFLAVMRGSIPINRAVIMLPTAMLFGVGLAQLITFASRIAVIKKVLFLLILISSIALPVLSARSFISRYPVSITPETYQGIQELREYVQKNNIRSFVIVTNTPEGTLAASAYYGLWNNWSEAVLPVKNSDMEYCIYFGKLENYFFDLPTVRGENQEYNDTNTESRRCVGAMQKSPAVFIIQGLYPGSYPPKAFSEILPQEVGSHVYQLKLLGTTSAFLKNLSLHAE
jgi:hypothetical protein